MGFAKQNSDEVSKTGRTNLKSNHKLTENAKQLRVNMTKEEKHLWYDFLKTLPVTVNRQKVIGKYIVDFYIASSNIVIEIDGSQHYEDDAIQKDKERDKYLKEQGIEVIRYSNQDINKRFKNVCEDILSKLITSSDG